jgi:hypothetical protein
MPVSLYPRSSDASSTEVDEECATEVDSTDVVDEGAVGDDAAAVFSVPADPSSAESTPPTGLMLDLDNVVVGGHPTIGSWLRPAQCLQLCEFDDMIGQAPALCDAPSLCVLPSLCLVRTDTTVTGGRSDDCMDLT